MSITQWHSNIKSRSIKETSYLNNCHLRSLLFLAGDVNSGMIHWLLTDLPTKPILASPVLATSNPAETVRQFHQLSYSVWRHLNTHMRAILDSRPKLYLLLEWWRRLLINNKALPFFVVNSVLSTLLDNAGDSSFWSVSLGLQIRVWNLPDNHRKLPFLVDLTLWQWKWHYV